MILKDLKAFKGCWLYKLQQKATACLKYEELTDDMWQNY